ncbi:hypothetical protein A2336_03070 [Candidatus Peregrinibacteria bacterium RIFOXYB2_FULL_41_88]|nr:MAG: hypothetical protein A2336_03070 [Candidatus Peregrinibacteria bacterium RIFOXYB2_FULL_41_88]
MTELAFSCHNYTIFFNKNKKMENLNVPGIGTKTSKKSKRQMIIGAVAASLLLVAVVFGATSNFFGALKSPVITFNVNLASSPVSNTVTGGDLNVPLAGFTFTASSTGSVTLNSLSVVGFIDDENGGASYQKGTSTDAGSLPVSSVVTSVWLEDSSGNVLGSAGTFDTKGKVSFTGLSFAIAASTTQTITVYGNISSSAGYNSVADRVCVDIPTVKDISATDSSGKTAGPQLVTHNTVGSSLVYIEIPVPEEALTFSIDEDSSDVEEESASSGTGSSSDSAGTESASSGTGSSSDSAGTESASSGTGSSSSDSSGTGSSYSGSGS